MIAKIAVISVLLALSLNQAEAQVMCTFLNVGGEYKCQLQGQTILSNADMQTVGGTHHQGMTNNDVIALTNLPNSASHIAIFPSLLAQNFPNLRRIQLANVRMREFTSPVSSVNPLTPSTCGNLTSIDISNNELTNIAGGMFLGCGQLRTINYANNQIDGISVGAFLGADVRQLTLSNNRLVVLSQTALAVASNLQILQADGNRIMSVTRNNFDSLPQLTNLHLHNNSLTSWNDDALPNQPHLTELRLDMNQIGNLSANAFLRLPALVTLNLADNQIMTLEENVFLQLPAVVNLYLASNQLTHLKAESIRPIAQMRILDVSNNNITTIERELFDGATALSFRSSHNRCFNGTVLIAGQNDFNNRVAALLNSCFSFATSVKVNVSILIVTVLISFIWKM